MLKKKFNCTQKELFAVCMLGWETCNQQIEKFTAFKSKYSSEFISERQNEIKTVMAMPGRGRRSAKQALLRLDVRRTNDKCTLAWRKLRSYIEEVWVDEDLKAYLQDAGSDFEEDARRYKFDSTQLLMTTAELMLLENKDEILSNKNMTEEFIKEFQALKEEFVSKYNTYLETNKLSHYNTNYVMEAMNKLYVDLMSMFSDAKLALFDEPELLKLFVFDFLLSTVSSSGWAGIKGSISSSDSRTINFDDVLVSLKETGEIADIEEDGRYQFSQLSSGIYTIEVNAEDYESQVLEGVEVKVGSYNIENIVLVPLNPIETPESEEEQDSPPQDNEGGPDSEQT
ncbi:MAG: carboxypeptidase-like regulatory domain-containing protein [Bacteroidia bacterium]